MSEHVYRAGDGWRIVEYYDELAEGIAQMLRDSSVVWPGGLGEEESITAEGVRRQREQAKHLAAMIAIMDGNVAGVCEMVEDSSEESTAYVAFLNVAPAYHGRKLGREMLRQAVAIAAEKGYQRLALDTWPGNLRAVPLYKKTGFFWRPGTEVIMENYLPTLLKLPLVQEFLGGRDWYECLERELAQQEDDIEEHGLRVYPYCFRVGDQTLRVLVDRHRWAIAGYEHPRFSIYPVVETQDVPIGSERKIVWHLSNHCTQPIHVAIASRGEGGVQSSLSQALEVRGNRTIEQSFTIVDNYESRDEEHEPAIGVVGNVVLGEEILPIAVGLRPKQAFELSLVPEHVGLIPGVEQEWAVNVRNNTSEGRSVRVVLVPDESLHLNVATATLDLPGNGIAGFAVKAKAERPGLYSISASASSDGAEQLQSRAMFHVPCVEAGELFAYGDDDETVMEGGGIRVTLARRGGRVMLHDRLNHRKLLSSIDNVGPPFWPRDLSRVAYEWQVRRENGALVATASVRSRNFPDVVITQEVALLPSGVVRRRCLARNTGAKAAALKLAYEGRVYGSVEARAMPLDEGLVYDHSHRFGSFPVELKGVYHFAESWCAMETDEHCVAGLIWHKGTISSHGLGLELDLGRIEPSGVSATEPIYLLCARGDWRCVRQAWRQYVSPGASEREQEIVPGLEARILPQPAVLRGGRQMAAIEVVQRDAKLLEGTLKLRLPEGWRVDRDSWRLRVPGPGRAFFSAALTPPEGQPRAFECDLAVDGKNEVRRWRQSLYVVGSSFGQVSLTTGEEEGKEAVYLDNGLFRAIVVPEYGGSLVALWREGINWLFSSFPTPRALSWMNDWYGGVRPYAYLEEPDRSAKESFVWEEVERKGSQGIIWRGVRVTATFEQKEARGLTLRCDYLTLPKSNVLALVGTIENLTSAALSPNAGVECYVAPGGSHETVLHYLRMGEELRHQRPVVAQQLWTNSGNWAAAEERQSGKSMALVAGGSDVLVTAVGLGAEGAHFRAQRRARQLAAGRQEEFVSYLVLADDVSQAKLYRDLSAAKGLF